MFCCNPPFDQKLVFSTLIFQPKTLMFNKKHNSKAGKAKIRKGIGKKKQDRKSKKRKDWWQKRCNLMLWCCSFHETKAKKKEKERKREKQETKRKQNRKTRRKNIMKRIRERQRKRNWKRGRPKKAKEKERETLKNKQKRPFLGGKQVFFVY